MKNLIVLAVMVVASLAAVAQNEHDNFYYTNGSEIIFSAADINIDGDYVSPVVRFTAFFHMENYINYDFGNAFGLMGGVAMRNVGFIYDQTDEIRKKHRVYTLGIPVGFKLGKLDEYFFYGGYEIEFPFNYKEKTFEGNQKEKFNEWFSPKTPTFYNTAFLGIQLPKGMSLKLKYYFTNFFDQSYTAGGVSPYENFNTNLFYISFGTKLVR